MARIRVPESERPSLLRFAKLDSSTIEQLVRALEGAPPALQPGSLSVYVSAQVPGIPANEVESIIEALMTLSSVQSSLEFSAEELADEVAQSADLSLSDDLRPQFAAHLTDLLNSRAIAIAAKALEVLLAHERVLHDSRVLTDIRPIFLGDSVSKPVAAGIIHTLRIRYHASGETRTFTVAMAPIDIEQLREQLDRAEAKAAALSDVLASAALPDLQNSGG